MIGENKRNSRKHDIIFHKLLSRDEFSSFACRTDRFNNSFFPSMIRVLNKY